MLPFSVPAGTSPRDYLLRVVPEAHRALVPRDMAAGKRWEVSVSLGGKHSARYEIEGATLTVKEGASDAHLALVLDEADVARFLADWSSARRWVPAFEPRGAALVTDPRVLSRVALVSGSVTATVPDLEGGPARLSLAAFGGKRGAFDPRDDEPDATLELPARTFEALLGGRLPPDEALASGDVTVRGKKLVAMQLAFALAPFFPPK